MNHKYAHLLQPVKLGKNILKNRMINAKSVAIQTDFDSMADFLGGLAKNGASIVTCAPGMFKEVKGHTFFTSDFDMDSREDQNGFKKVIERIHCYGSLASASTMCYLPNDVSISDIRDWSLIPDRFPPGPEGIYYTSMDPDAMGKFGGEQVVPPEITKEQIKEFIALFTSYCVRLKELGFDMVNIYASYNASILGKSLSRVLNQRTDEYGGSNENRVRLLCELLTSVKEACGWDYPIELQISGHDPLKGGFTEEDFVEYCKILDSKGLVDIFQVRAWSGDYTHTNSYTSTKENPTNLRFAAMLKEAGVKAYVAPVGGFQDPAVMERVIAEGKCDLIALARAFICDENYYDKILAGKGEDVMSCIRCDKCHAGHCSINPKLGLSQDVLKAMYSAPTTSKKVAVIGGGPSGMKAAITAAERGHQVTLFEKETYLGGQLRHTDFMDCKWGVKEFKDYLIHRMSQLGVDVRLGVCANADIIEAGGYDAVIAGTGSTPKKGSMPGADGANVWAPIDVFGHESELAHEVVVVGGAMIAADTAMYLCNQGHKVTMITRQREAAHDYSAHSGDAFKDYLNSRPNISFITMAQTTLIEEDGVTYTDRDGVSHKVPCGSVVVANGRIPNTKEAYEFAGSAPQFFVVGDACSLSDTSKMGHGGPHGPKEDPNKDTTDAGIRHSIFTGFSAASCI